MRRILASTLALAGLCTLYSIASAAPFTNGSFEVGQPPPPSRHLTGSTGIDGWTVVADPIHYIGSETWNASDGERSIDLDALSGESGGMAQTFDTVAGQQYSVTFDLAGNPAGGPLVKPMEVSAGGDSQVFTYDIGAVDPPPGPWTLDYATETFSFTATGPSTTLTFASLTSQTPEGGGWGAVIDNVQVTAQAVPEPGTWLLLGMGLTGLAAWRRKGASA